MEVRAGLRRRHGRSTGARSSAGRRSGSRTSKLTLIDRLAAQRGRACRRRPRRGADERAPHDHARPLEAPPGRDRRHGQRARARRANRSERPVLRPGGAPARPPARRGSRSSGDDPDELEAALREGFDATSASSRAGSGRPTTTGRSSSWRASPGRALEVDAGARGRDRPDLAPLRRADEAPLRRLRSGRAQAGDAAGRRRLARHRGHGSRRRARHRDAVSSSSCPALPASCSGSGRAPSSRRRCSGCSARTTQPERRVLRLLRRQRVGRREGTRRRRRRRRRRRGDDLRPRLRDPRRPGRRARCRTHEPTRSRRRSSGRSRSTSSGATSDRCRSSCSSAAARVGSRSARRSRAPVGSSPGGSRRSPARATSSAAASLPTTTTSRSSRSAFPPTLLADHGAVSAEVAAAMASGARERLGVDVAVSVTGIAGPGGGTPEKPVGLVFFHAAGPMGERSLRIEIPGEREWIRAPLGRRGAPSRAAPARGLASARARGGADGHGFDPGATHTRHTRSVSVVEKEPLAQARTYVCITSDRPAYLHGRRPHE